MGDTGVARAAVLSVEWRRHHNFGIATGHRPGALITRATGLRLRRIGHVQQVPPRPVLGAHVSWVAC
jgi:hypothetical protein